MATQNSNKKIQAHNYKVLKRALAGIGLSVFTLVGVLGLYRSFAATPFVTAEPETGSLHSPVVAVQDGTASGGRAVQFGKADPSGTAYYVDCDAGSDSAAGTAAGNAWKTLAKASGAALNPGESLLLKRGCTFTAPLTLSRSGTVAKPIVIGAYGNATSANPVITRSTSGDDVVVSASYVTIQDLTLTANPPATDATSGVCRGTAIGYTRGVMFASGAAYNKAQRLTVRGHYAGVFIDTGAHNNQVVQNTLTNNTMMNPLNSSNDNDDAGAFGVAIWGDDNDISGNTISGHDACSYDYGRDGAAVEIYGGQRNSIHNNTANNNETFSELGNSRSRDNVYAYNVVTSNLTKSAFLVTRGAQDGFGPVTGTKAYNNTVYMTGSNGSGAVCYAGCTAGIMTLRNNIIWANQPLYADGAFNESNNLYWKSGGSPQITGSTATTSKRNDPLFVQIGSDFHLKAGSPAINGGSSESVSAGFTTDINGTAVPKGSAVDIGAYEY